MPSQIKIYPYNELGHANHGWLDARHHFSFARYWNPERTGFGALLVVNDDKVAAGAGFAPHPHDNMEIITYVRSGAITHQDSNGNKGRTETGNVQVMSAGSGITHSEANKENGETTLYQIWIKPNVENVEPRWDMREFPRHAADGKLSLLVSGMKEHQNENPLFIYQDAAIYGGQLDAGTTINHAIKHQAYILVSKGTIKIDDTLAKQGDGIEITNTKEIGISAINASEILVIDVPASS